MFELDLFEIFESFALSLTSTLNKLNLFVVNAKRRRRLYVNTLPRRDAFMVGLPYLLFFEDIPFFLMKTNLSSKESKKCPNVLLFGLLNSENMFNHAYTKILGSFQISRLCLKD